MDGDYWEEKNHEEYIKNHPELKQPCKIINQYQDVNIYKLKCETHDQSLLYIYTYGDKICVCCQVGEDNHSGGDYDSPFVNKKSENE
jgi:hypothetical protein